MISTVYGANEHRSNEHQGRSTDVWAYISPSRASGQTWSELRIDKRIKLGPQRTVWIGEKLFQLITIGDVPSFVSARSSRRPVYASTAYQRINRELRGIQLETARKVGSTCNFTEVL